jgi:hypothetical protein
MASSDLPYHTGHQGTEAWREWIDFVRTTIAPEGSDASEEEDAERERVVTAVGVSGRPLFVPGRSCPLLPPKPLPPRGAAAASGGYYSLYTLCVGPCAAPQRVPEHMIVRDHGHTAVRSPAMCVGCAHQECSHGWSLPEPKQVIVLALRRGRDVHYGWFVRFRGNLRRRQELVKVPTRIVALLHRQLVADAVLRASALVRKYPDADTLGLLPAGEGFAALVHRSLAAPRKRARPEAEAEPQHAPEPCAAATSAPAPGGVCVVCLEESSSSRPRCRAGGCTTLICNDCHHATRGLCPICDRGLFAADYLCSGCGRVEQLADFGLPCHGCGNAALCGRCYRTHTECEFCARA